MSKLTGKPPGRPREHTSDAARRRAFDAKLADNGLKRVQVKIPDTPEYLAKIRAYARELCDEYWEEQDAAEAEEFAPARHRDNHEARARIACRSGSAAISFLGRAIAFQI
jgi:hypothetical protein